MAIIPGAIPVTGFLGPTDSADVYAVTDSIYGVDGLRNVVDHTERNAITAERRRQGMFVGTQNDSKYWSLNAGPWNFDDTDWTLALDLSAGPLTEIWETIGSDIQTSTSLFSPAVPNVLPAFDDQQDLGSKTKRWKDLYLGSVVDFVTVLDIRRDTDIVSTFDTTGLVLPDGKLIKADNGGGQLDLRPFGNDSFALTNDAGGYAGSWLYGSTTTAQFGFGSAMQAAFSSQVVATTNYNYTGTHVYSDMQSTGYELSIVGSGRSGQFLLRNNTSGSFASANLNQYGSILSSRNSTMNSGIYNSAIIGGTGITANKADYLFVGNLEIQGGIGLYTVDPTTNGSWGNRAIPDKKYVDDAIATAIAGENYWDLVGGDLVTDVAISPDIPNVLPRWSGLQSLGSASNRWQDLYLSSSIDFESGIYNGILSPATLTAARTWSLPNTSGTLALLSDITTPTLAAVMAVGSTAPSLTTPVTINTSTGFIDSTLIMNFISGSSLVSSNSSTLAASFITLKSSTGTTLVYTADGVDTMEMTMTPSIWNIQDAINSKGMEYAADYSANYTNRSIVDKEYVDNATTSAPTKFVTNFTPGTVGVANTINHGLNTLDVMVQIWYGNILITADTVEVTDANNVDITFTGANPSGVSPDVVKVTIIGL